MNSTFFLFTIHLNIRKLKNKLNFFKDRNSNKMFTIFNREVSRTEGISTTDLVGRMLLLTKNHFRQGEKEYAIEKEGLLNSFIHV